MDFDNTDPRNYRLDKTGLASALESSALAPYTAQLIDAVKSQQAELRHGDLSKWVAALKQLPELQVSAIRIDQATVSIDGNFNNKQLDENFNNQQLTDALMQLCPWRKGPFRIGEIKIVSEWRSDWKWDRLAQHITPLTNRTVLDVGCGNGYHLWRLRGAGAATVLGIDPSLLFAMQFSALQHYIDDTGVQMLPLPLEVLPHDMRVFDTVLSMGVLYHRKDPHQHLQQLRDAMRPGGELLLETLVMLGDDDDELMLDRGRYARMRNIWALPSMSRVVRWLDDAGFTNIRCISLEQTSCDEQRSTDWMPFESLAQALDPDAPSLTIEGWPRPHRAMFLANKIF